MGTRDTEQDLDLQGRLIKILVRMAMNVLRDLELPTARLELLQVLYARHNQLQWQAEDRERYLRWMYQGEVPDAARVLRPKPRTRRRR